MIAARRMRNAAWVIVATLMSASGSCSVEFPLCPDGWTEDDADRDRCREPAGLAAAHTAAHGSGVYGFTRHVAPCAACGGGECPIEVIGTIDVRAFHAEDVFPSGEQGCDRPFRPLPGATPFAVTTSADDGAYVLPLPPGRWAITAVSPNDACDFLAAKVRVPDTGFVRVVLHFESF
jgi:hypothetical protein